MPSCPLSVRIPGLQGGPGDLAPPGVWQCLGADVKARFEANRQSELGSGGVVDHADWQRLSLLLPCPMLIQWVPTVSLHSCDLQEQLLNYCMDPKCALHMKCEMLQLQQQHSACGTCVTCARCNGTHTGAVEAWQATGQHARRQVGMSSDDSGDEDVEEETEGTDDQEYDSGGSALASEAESEEAKTRRRSSKAATGSTSGLRGAAASRGRRLNARGAARPRGVPAPSSAGAAQAHVQAAAGLQPSHAPGKAEATSCA
jgi:hypothetical protein